MHAPSPAFAELDQRAREIFRAVVEGYIGTGAPMGSKTLAGVLANAGMGLSPASIRGVMAELEGLGLLAHPHTSAGRVPTEVGLRLFVDGMMQMNEPTVEERAAIERGVEAGGTVETALAAVGSVLSGLSACAGLVMVPRREPRLAQFGLVPLGPGRALAVLVGVDGTVENRVVELPVDVAPGALAEAANFITHHLGGRTLGEAVLAMTAEIAGGRAALDSAAAGLVQRGLAVLTEDAGRRPVLIVRGAANLLDDGALGDIERVRSLIEDLESKQSVAELLERAVTAQSTRIFIGSENRLFALSGSSVIASPWRDGEGRVVGVVGVIGPTRLNYARLVPMVDFTARSLGRLIG